MIVDTALYRDGARQPFTLDEASLAALRSEPTGKDAFLWVGLHDPDAHELGAVAEVLALPHLAVEDALTTRQRPKVEPYESDDVLFVVLKTLWYLDGDQVETGQIAVFLGRDFVVTVRNGSGVELASVRHDLEVRSQLLCYGPSAVLYAVCDHVVDGYEDVASALDDDVNEVESTVFSPDPSYDPTRIYGLKREIAEVRRAVHPLRVPMQRLAGSQYPLVDPEAATFFRDVADHVQRVAEVVESFDALLSTAFEAQSTQLQVRQNDDMRKISAWVAIAGVSTLIAGLYGMNFEHMPELGWRFGYAWALGLMLLSSVYLYRRFKRAGWL